MFGQKTYTLTSAFWEELKEGEISAHDPMLLYGALAQGHAAMCNPRKGSLRCPQTLWKLANPFKKTFESFFSPFYSHAKIQSLRFWEKKINVWVINEDPFA